MVNTGLRILEWDFEYIVSGGGVCELGISFRLYCISILFILLSFVFLFETQILILPSSHFPQQVTQF